MQQSYFAKVLISGKEVLHNQVVEVQDGIVKSIYSNDAGISVNFKGHYLVPTFIDLQIYGAAGKLFSMYPTADSLQTITADSKLHGTSQILITIATNTDAVVFKSIDAVREYWNTGGTGIIGLHLEGPWINKVKRGAHIESLIQNPDVSVVDRILKYGKDVVKMITLAPEVSSNEVTELIKSYGIVISAGHSNATLAEASQSFSMGITAVTHLFNAMSPFHHRDIGLPGAAFMHDSVMASIIVDGHHVDFNAIKIAKQLMGDRLFLITDAVAETKEGPYQHRYSDGRYLSDNTLSGSALTMLQAVKNCIAHCDISAEEAFKMASFYPAKLLNLPGGNIELNQRASFVLLDEGFDLLTVCT